MEHRAVLSPLSALSGHEALHCTLAQSGHSELHWVKRTCPFALHMSANDPKRHCPAFYVAARSESQLYQNICLSRYDAVSSAAGGWPVNGAPPFSLPDAGDSTAVRLSAPGAVRHDVANQVAHVVLQISDDVLDDVSDRVPAPAEQTQRAEAGGDVAH